MRGDSAPSARRLCPHSGLLQMSVDTGIKSILYLNLLFLLRGKHLRDIQHHQMMILIISIPYLFQVAAKKVSLDISLQLICSGSETKPWPKQPSGINEYIASSHPRPLFLCGKWIQISHLKVKRLEIVLK